MTTKDMQRMEIERQTAEYLARGGKIDQIPTGHSAIDTPRRVNQRQVRERVKRERRHHTLEGSNSDA